MSGSRLGRGRVGRLALLTAGVLVIVFLIYLYRSTTSEMARLRDLHVKCAQQQEALAAQLQVIYEYKVQLEKTLSNEKSSNAAAKEELQQKASRERSLRDKDSLEAMQRYNSLQQHYKILQSEHQDLQEDCKKKEEVALQNANKLEATLKELRIELKKAAEDKEKSLENLKRKFEEMASERDQLEEKYSSLKKSTGENNGNVERLQKQVMQLQRELDEAKGSPHFSVGGMKIESDNTQVVQPRHVNEPIIDGNDNNSNNDNNNNNHNNNNNNNQNNNNDDNNNNVNAENEKPGASDNNQMQMIRPSSQQQVSPPSDELQGGRNPQPLQAPQDHRHLDDGEPADKSEANNNNNNNNYKGDDSLGKDEARFENRDGNIVPVGPNEQYDLPQQPDGEKRSPAMGADEAGPEQRKQVLAAPPNPAEAAPSAKEPPRPLSSRGPMVVPMLKPQANGWQAEQPGNEQNSVGDPNDFD